MKKKRFAISGFGQVVLLDVSEVLARFSKPALSPQDALFEFFTRMAVCLRPSEPVLVRHLNWGRKSAANRSQSRQLGVYLSSVWRVTVRNAR